MSSFLREQHRRMFSDLSSSMDFDIGDTSRRLFEQFPRSRMRMTRIRRPSHHEDIGTTRTLFKGRPSRSKRMSAMKSQGRQYIEPVDNDLSKGESFFQDVNEDAVNNLFDIEDDVEEEVGFVDGLIRQSFGSRKKKGKVHKLKKAVLREDLDSVKKLVEVEDVSAQDSYGKTALHLAALVQNVQIVQILLKKKADVTALDNFEDTPLHTAVRTGNKEVIQALLEDERTKVNYCGKNKVTPLHIAARLDKDDSGQICQLLMDRKADLFAKDEDGNIPITLAAMKGIEQNMKPMIEHAIATNQKVERIMYNIDNRGSSLLHVAVRSRDIEAVKVCMEFDSRIGETRHFDGTTPVHLACVFSQVEILRLLFKKKTVTFDHSIKDKDGYTCLHRAAKAGNSNIIDILLDKAGRDFIDCCDNNKRTPLLLASAKGHTEVINQLLLRRANLNMKDVHNRTAFHYAVGHLDALQSLIRRPLSRSLLRVQDKAGATALHTAAKKGETESAIAILSTDRDLANVQDDNGDLPLHIAAREGWFSMVKHLLRRTNISSVNYVNKDEQTPLHMASGEGHSEIVDYLLQRGANVVKDRHGRTALHLAALSGSLQSVQMLLETNFDILNEEDSLKETALNLAAQGGHDHIVTYLMSIDEQQIKLNSVNMNPLDKAIEMDHDNVAMALAEHHRWREVIRRVPRGMSQLEQLLAKMPNVAEVFLDKCVQREGDPSSVDYKVTHDLTFIQGMADETQDSPKTSLKPLYCMALNNCDSCLTHPLSYTLMGIKWRRYGLNVFLTNQFLALVYGILVCALVSTLVENPCFEKLRANSSVVCVPEGFDGDLTWPKLVPHESYHALEVLLSLITILIIIRHGTYIYSMRFRYFKNISYLLEMTQCICMLTFLWSSGCQMCYGAGAIAVCLCWLTILSRVSWGTFLSVYVRMLFRILETALKVFFLLFLIIVCFSFCFYVANPTNVLFVNVPQSIVSTFMMMLGSLSYNGIFLDEENPLRSPGLMYFVFMLFCVVMPILFLNLLIGLAVGDTESIQKYATMQSYINQVEQLYDIEQSLPNFLLKKWWTENFVEYPNKPRTWVQKVGDFLITHQLKKPEEQSKEEDDSDLQQIVNRQGEILDEFTGNLESHNNQIDGIRLMIGRIARAVSRMKETQSTQTDATPRMDSGTDPDNDFDRRMLERESRPTPGKTYQYKYVYKIKYGKRQ